MEKRRNRGSATIDDGGCGQGDGGFVEEVGRGCEKGVMILEAMEGRYQMHCWHQVVFTLGKPIFRQVL